MKIRAFITHKLAEHFCDCQDRFSINPDTKSVALADGMSQSYQQKIWAKLLVDSYLFNIDFVPNKESIKELSIQWRDGVTNYIEQLKANNAPEYLIIMNENALAMHKSAGATFLGIRFNGNKWEGDVLGDSCLLEVENNQIKKIHTSQQGDEFDNHPDYFDSDASKEGKGTPLHICGEITSQTNILLVSDPFSDFLNERKKGGKEELYIKELLQVTNHDEFEALVDKWRKEYGMHNDDSTLIIIEYEESDDFHCHSVDDIQSLILEEQKQQEQTEPKKENNEAIQNVVNSIMPEPQSEPAIADEPIVVPITEDEFVKMLLEEYELASKGRKYLGRKLTKKNVDEFLNKTARSLYKKYNITRK